MTCISDLIGIKNGCSDTIPVSGLYVNDLPGMSLKIADAAANSEKVNGFTLIQNRIDFASTYLSNDIRTYLQDKFVINSILESSKAGFYKDDNDIIASSNKLKGIKVTVREEPFININISKIGLRFDSVQTTNIYIYNLYTAELLYTLPITTVADEITYITVNKQIATNKQRLSLFICTDVSVSDYYDSSVLEVGNKQGCSTCQSSRYLSRISGGSLDPALSKTESNFVSANNTGGITLDYTIECDMDNYICSLGRSLSWSLLYKTGHLIMQELINSDQLNTVVMINKSRNEELLSYYEAEYIKSINQLTSNLKTPDDICFNCSPRIKKVTQLP